jgi:ribosomal protein S27E
MLRFVEWRNGGEASGAGNGVTLTRRLRMRCGELIASCSRPPRIVEVHRRQDMNWTCPDCRARHETVIHPDAEPGEIVNVTCQACGTQREASVFFPLRRPGKARMTVGVVWL